MLPSFQPLAGNSLNTLRAPYTALTDRDFLNIITFSCEFSQGTGFLELGGLILEVIWGTEVPQRGPEAEETSQIVHVGKTTHGVNKWCQHVHIDTVVLQKICTKM